ncbi:MAG: FixH family protein [Myxococcales bacterium]|nr:FixH family protein [Myxococcales bacterium]
MKYTPLLALLLALFVSACGDDPADPAPTNQDGVVQTDQGHYALTILEPTGDPSVGELSLRFELADADGAAVIGATIVAEESMPSMGHGGGGTPSVSEVGDGVYDVDGVVFSMAGFWEVTLDISSDGVSDTITLQYDVE